MLNLFRREGETPLCCILPDGARMPAFLSGGDWTYLGKTARGDVLPSAVPDAALVRRALCATGYALVEAELSPVPRPAPDETGLDALLADPLVRLVMARDGADEAAVRALALAARGRMNGAALEA